MKLKFIKSVAQYFTCCLDFSNLVNASNFCNIIKLKITITKNVNE